MGRKLNKRTTATIGSMIALAVVILIFYSYLNNRVSPVQDASVKNLTEAEKILNLDLKNYYPETPREAVKTFARITKELYSNPKDDEIEPLAMKLRELCDKEFLDQNPKDTYLKDLKAEIAKWKDDNRKITNYRLVNKDIEESKEIDGVKYSVNYVSYTIQENEKFTENWKVLLRQDENKKWKIVGWEYSPENGQEAKTNKIG